MNTSTGRLCGLSQERKAMQVLKGLKDIHALTKQVKELEESLKVKDKLISKLEGENSSLNVRIKEMVSKYGGIDSELADMKFRMYLLEHDNNVLKLNLVGARAQRDGAMRWIEQMKEKVYGSGST
jgi:chromosome segregation ATPase